MVVKQYICRSTSAQQDAPGGSPSFWSVRRHASFRLPRYCPDKPCLGSLEHSLVERGFSAHKLSTLNTIRCLYNVALTLSQSRSHKIETSNKFSRFPPPGNANNRDR